MKDKYITEMVKQHLQDRGLENLCTTDNLNYYIRKAKANGNGGNRYLLALNVVDMIIFNEPAIIARHYLEDREQEIEMEETEQETEKAA